MTLLFFLKPHHRLISGDDTPPHAFGAGYDTSDGKKDKKRKKKKTLIEKWNEEDDIALWWWRKNDG